MSDDQRTRKRPRSPSYPAIPLAKAVSRAELIYKHEGKYPAPVDAILAHWGYNSNNGRAARQVAAVKKFGLVEEEGSKANRQLQLTDLGLRIVMPDSPERTESLKIAAMKPAIHRELKAKFSDGLPSDRNVRWYLVSERGFTEEAAKKLMAEYRATMSYAGLDGTADEGDTLEATDDPDWDDDTSQGEDMTGTPTSPPAASRPPAPTSSPPGGSGRHPDGSALRGVTIPLPGTAWVKLEGEFPMGEDSWEQMMTMLAAMKPGLTRADD
jgi:hypothetical protein